MHQSSVSHLPSQTCKTGRSHQWLTDAITRGQLPRCFACVWIGSAPVTGDMKAVISVVGRTDRKTTELFDCASTTVDVRDTLLPLAINETGRAISMGATDNAGGIKARVVRPAASDAGVGERCVQAASCHQSKRRRRRRLFKTSTCCPVIPLSLFYRLGLECRSGQLCSQSSHNNDQKHLPTTFWFAITTATNIQRENARIGDSSLCTSLMA